jgi:hypothetical protein
MTAVASQRDPAHATVRGLSWLTLRRQDCTIDARVRGHIESTATDFHVAIQLNVTMDETPHFQKRWVRTIPRHLL